VTSGRPAAVALDGIAKRFGAVVALERVTLEVGDGEFVCFLGPSGCGKTTLLRIIAGLERQNLGTVRMAGRDVSGLPPRERNYGIVFQSYALFPNLTVARNVGYGLATRRVPRERIAARVGRLELRHRAGAARPAGTRLALAIRPEEIRVGAPTHEAVDNRVAARVVTVQFLGAFARLLLALPGDGGPELECDLAGDALADAGAKEGAELALVLTPEALRVFPEPA